MLGREGVSMGTSTKPCPGTWAEWDAEGAGNLAVPQRKCSARGVHHFTFNFHQQNGDVMALCFWNAENCRRPVEDWDPHPFASIQRHPEKAEFFCLFVCVFFFYY